jgi:hypothetical protein
MEDQIKTAQDKAREKAHNLGGESTVTEEEQIKQGESALATLPKDFLQRFSGVGMRNVDPMDIKPPMCLLVQKISDTSQMVTAEGDKPVPGDFFHTGKNEIYSFVECAIVYAAKSQYTDKNHPEKGLQNQYRAIAVSLDDLKEFGLVFRSTAEHALSSLFSKATSANRPMFSFMIKIESKKLVNSKNQEYFIPVVRVEQPIDDSIMLQDLYQIAKKFDKEIKTVEVEDEEPVEDIVIPDEEPKKDEMPF